MTLLTDSSHDVYSSTVRIQMIENHTDACLCTVLCTLCTVYVRSMYGFMHAMYGLMWQIYSQPEIKDSIFIYFTISNKKRMHNIRSSNIA